MIYSSIKINKALKISDYKHADKIFTVYDNNAHAINCGAKHCLRCKLCYGKNRTKYISERLKTNDTRKNIK